MGEYWRRVTLRDLGLIYQLRHGGGPCAIPSQPALTLVVIDSTGIHTISAHQCGCSPISISKHVQLLCERLYPATVVNPQTCATFNVLELFHKLNVVGGVNVHDFIGALERLTDPTGVSTVPVCISNSPILRLNYNV